MTPPIVTATLLGMRVPTRMAIVVIGGALVGALITPSTPAGAAPTHPPVSAGAAPAPADSFTVLASGDVLIHQGGRLVATAAQAGRASGTGYDFTPILAPVAPTVRAADLAICHLETPVADADGPFTGYPAFSVQPQILDALVATGYDICSTASNHSLDTGFAGLVRTADAMDAAGLRHTGTFRTEQEGTTPLVVDVAGVEVGHVSWTYGLNGIREPGDKPWAVNDFDPSRPDVSGILADAARARQAGAQVVIASVHCCVEYTHDPTPAQRAIAAALLASPDIDLVLGHHAHVVQPVERIGEKWVAYGLGNHLAGQAGTDPNDSVLVTFTFTRGPDGHYRVTRVEALPTLIRRGPAGVDVVPTAADDLSHRRVAGVLGSLGAVADGLVIDPAP